MRERQLVFEQNIQQMPCAERRIIVGRFAFGVLRSGDATDQAVYGGIAETAGDDDRRTEAFAQRFKHIHRQPFQSRQFGFARRIVEAVFCSRITARQFADDTDRADLNG